MAKASGPQRPRRRFGRVRKLPSGHYQAGYLAPDGSVIYAERTFPTKAVADRFLVLTESEMLSGTWTAPERRRETVSEWAERWWRRDHLRRSTAVRDNGYLRRYILPELGALPLAEIDRETVQAWADKLGERLAPATVKQALLLLGQLVDGAVEDGLLRSRPWRRIVLPHQERAEMRFLDPPEIERLAAAIDPRYKALVIVGAYGGLRIGELAGLRCKSITATGEVTVTETATEAEGVVTIGPPKTRAGIRNLCFLPAPPKSSPAALPRSWIRVPKHGSSLLQTAVCYAQRRGGPGSGVRPCARQPSNHSAHTICATLRSHSGSPLASACSR